MALTKATGKMTTFLNGATGSVTRDMHDKLADVVSVKDFGAVGDGVTDDTAAIQAALDSGSSIVFVPKGIYRISSVLLIPSFTTFKGEGKNSTTIYPTAAMTAAAASGTGNNFIANASYATAGQSAFGGDRDIIIQGFSFYYQLTTPGINDKFNCIGFNNVVRAVVDDCYFAYLSQHAVDISGCKDVVVKNCTAINGYWSQFQVDTAGGLYNNAYDLTHQSEAITIENCIVTGTISSRGAIQIHKNGCDGLTIKNCYLENNLGGISTDEYWVDNFDVGQSRQISITDCRISSTVADSYGIRLSKELEHVSVIDCWAVVLGKPLEIRGGKPSYWSTRIDVRNCVLAGTTIDLIGVNNLTFDSNKVDLTSGKITYSCRYSTVSNNYILGHGFDIQDVTETDPRDSSTYTYRPANNYFINNNFSTSRGDSKSFTVSATANFHVCFFVDNSYFATGTAYDFTGASVTSGFVVKDYFREGLRAVSTAGRLTNGLLVGQQSYDVTLGKPIWWNGSVWKDAAGTTV